jgi:succinate dehydrogenase / fumarate reductase cytochrome b subunit
MIVPMTTTNPSAFGGDERPKQNAIGRMLHTHRFVLRRLHSLMGVIFGGYIVVHLLINATLIEAAFPGFFLDRGDVYQDQVDIIHDLPFLVLIEWSAIGLPILFHAVYGTLVAFSGRSNVGHYSYGKNWAYTIQRLTSYVLLVFIAFHVLTMKGVIGGEFGDRVTFVPDAATQSTVNHLHAAWWIGWVLYPLGILAATFHLSNGLWTAAITWGLTITAKSQQLWGVACVGIFAFTTACGFVSLGSALAAEPKWDGYVEELQEDREMLPTEEGGTGDVLRHAVDEASDLLD